MKTSMKSKISRTLSKNKALDKKALQLKQSWDQVDALLGAKEKRRKKKDGN